MNGIGALLLATDLGFRCDRATDRALRLARGFDGPALAATVVEPAERLAQRVPRVETPGWHREPAPLAAAERRLRREFEGEARAWDVRVDEGRAGERVSRLLDTLPADALAVTGPVREGVLGPAVLGSTVDALLRRPGGALLIVRRRVHADYRHLLVASDFSEPARLALRRARALFPDAKLTLLHGFAIPMLGLMDTSQDQAIAETARRLRDEGRAFLREDGFGDDAIELIVEHGDPARLAQQHLDTFGADLVVVGTHGRGAMYELVVGSVARRILTTVDADALVVRA